LRARIGRHLRRDKPQRWHVDRLTAAGRVVGVRAVPGGRECDLVRDLLLVPGVSVPVSGFGSSDCRTCPAHLVMVPVDFEPGP
jgi:Uri superfamily endonuclease